MNIFWQNAAVVWGANAALFGTYRCIEKLGATEALTDLMVAVL